MHPWPDSAGGNVMPENVDRRVGTWQEALYLIIIGSLGVLLNVVVVCCVLSRHCRRRHNSYTRDHHMTVPSSAFLLHGCFLDTLKSIYCLAWARSLVRSLPPPVCPLLGAVFVFVLTMSALNLVATICAEAFVFSQQLHRVTGVPDRGAFSCVLFGIAIIYTGSLIVHLGPTIIGGEFDYNKRLGNCMFIYGTVKSYVVHSMWIVLTSATLAFTVYYSVVHWRHIAQHSTHRLAALVRTSLQISRGDTHDREPEVGVIVTSARARTLALMAATLVFIVLWFPLFTLTLIDPAFSHPASIYQALSLLACSQASVAPLLTLLAHPSISPFAHCRWCRHRQASRTPATSNNMKRLVDPELLYRRIGSRLNREIMDTEPCNGGVSKS